MPDVTTALVLLAAGEGARFGGDKLAALLDGTPLIDHAIALAERTRVDHRIIVRRPDAPALRLGPSWQVAVNADATEGMGTSIRAGIAAAAGSFARVVIALGDMPFVGSDHLDRLAKAEGTVFTRQPDGSRGAPAGFDRAVFAALMTLEGDRGAATLDLPDIRIIDAPSPGDLRDIDIPHDLEGGGSAKRYAT